MRIVFTALALIALAFLINVAADLSTAPREAVAAAEASVELPPPEHRVDPETKVEMTVP